MRFTERHYRWEWRLRSSPDQLWPFVADTNRFNRETGLPAVEPADIEPRANARQLLRFRRLGMRVEWEEEPFEWVRPERFGVVRRYRSGPVASLRVLAELAPLPEGGTRLVYQSWIIPRTLVGLIVVPPFMALNRRSFGAAFRRYDRLAMQSSPIAGVAGKGVTVTPTSMRADPNVERGPAVRLEAGAAERLVRAARELAQVTGEAALVEQLIRTMGSADDLTVARIRPYALADSWGAPRRKLLELCLHATRAGLFDLQWDVLCPLCRGAKESASRLADMRTEVHCATCNIDFGANFDRSVELTFHASPSVRIVEDRDFCVGGPRLTPHIVAQQLLAAGSRRSVALALEPGRYRVRTLGLTGGQFLVAAADGADELVLSASSTGWASAEITLSLRPTLHFDNATEAEQLFILERMAWSDQAATAAEVTSLQAFRDLFSLELLRPGERISVGNLAIVFTDLRDSTSFYQEVGDAPAFGQVLDHFAVLREAIADEDGALVKTIGDAVMAVFRRPVSAVLAMLRAQDRLNAPLPGTPRFHLKAGVHYGPCIAVTLNDRLDYFGSVVNMAARLERFSSGEDVIVTDVVRQDPEVAELLAATDHGLVAERFEAPLKGFDGQEFALWRVRRSEEPQGAGLVPSPLDGEG